MSSLWTCIPLTMTRSAQRMSLSSRASKLRPTSLNFQFFGQSAATVSRPRGGWMVSCGMRSSIASKPQKEGGKRGHIIRTLIAAPRGGKLCGSLQSAVSAGVGGFWKSAIWDMSPLPRSSRKFSGVGSVEQGRIPLLPAELIAQFPHVSYRLYWFDTFLRPFDLARIGLDRLFQPERDLARPKRCGFGTQSSSNSIELRTTTCWVPRVFGTETLAPRADKSLSYQ